jgi:hypothetical protein
MKVPIRNLYYILCFAWKAIPERIAFDLAALDACEDVVNLCAYVLTSGIDHLLRRGLDRGYLLTQEQTSRLRGRILITQTVKHRNLSSPTASASSTSSAQTFRITRSFVRPSPICSAARKLAQRHASASRSVSVNSPALTRSRSL